MTGHGPAPAPITQRVRPRATLADSCLEVLLSAIQAGTYPAGSQLPSESQLAESLGVSRATLREALRLLQERGIIQRLHGRGTYVTDPASAKRINKDLDRNSGITTMIEAAGHVPSTRALRISSRPASPETAALLRLPASAEVWSIERLRLADDRPVVFSTDTLARELVTDDEVAKLSSGSASLYELLFRTRGLVIERGEAALVPVTAGRRLAGLLEVRPGAPLLCIRQVDFTRDRSPVVYSVEHHVSDWVTFSVTRQGPGAPPAVREER